MNWQMTRPLLVVLAVLLLVNSCPAQDRIGELAGRLTALPPALLTEPRTDNQLIEALSLATLMRLPNPGERNAMQQLLKRAGNDRKRACQDIIWAMVNSKEFITLHGFTMAEIMKLNQQLTRMSERK